MKMEDTAHLFSEVLGKKIDYKKLPGILTRIFMGKNLYLMFSYMNKNNFNAAEDIDAIKEEFGLIGNLKSWIENEFKTSFS